MPLEMEFDQIPHVGHPSFIQALASMVSGLLFMTKHSHLVMLLCTSGIFSNTNVSRPPFAIKPWTLPDEQTFCPLMTMKSSKVREWERKLEIFKGEKHNCKNFPSFFDLHHLPFFESLHFSFLYSPHQQSYLLPTDHSPHHLLWLLVAFLLFWLFGCLMFSCTAVLLHMFPLHAIAVIATSNVAYSALSYSALSFTVSFTWIFFFLSSSSTALSLTKRASPPTNHFICLLFFLDASGSAVQPFFFGHFPQFVLAIVAT